ncbi:MAG: DUF5691 domain-containing protein [Phycisphaerae bacterium]
MPLPEWIDQLAATAMLGTERAGNAPLSAPGDATLDPVIEKISFAPREHAVLAAASIAFVYAKAGTLPVKIAAIPPTAPAADKPSISAASAQHLALMLKDHYTEVLPEYLDLVAGANRSLPPKHLPALLSLAARDEKLRPHILPNLGARGEWLAAQNRDWSTLSSAPETDLYHTGTGTQRLAVLQHLRKTDPARARNLMISTWSEEKPEDRASFIETLAADLSMEDEPFLESALDDKRKEVRMAAANLLAGLPESRLAQRMIARITPLVSVTKKILGRPKVEINVPEKHDPSMSRDGIDAKSTRPGVGDKASHLADIIAATPLSFWRSTTGLDAASLLKSVANLEWKQAIIAGLFSAAVRQKNGEYAAALLTYRVKECADSDRTLNPQDLNALLLLLTPAQREAILAPFLSQKNLFDGATLIQLLLASRHPWTKQFSELFLQLLWHIVDSGTGHYWGNQALSKSFALYANPAILPAINAKLQLNEQLRSDALDKFLATLHFRHDLHKELSP